MKRTHLPLVAAIALVLAACSDDPVAPPDAGSPAAQDAGFDAGLPPPCAVGCDEIPDAGTSDAGLPVEVKLTTVTPARGRIGGGTSVTFEGKGFVNGFADLASMASWSWSSLTAATSSASAGSTRMRAATHAQGVSNCSTVSSCRPGS